MFASQLISHEVFPLKKSDSAEAALLLMQECHVSHLPVVVNSKVLGYTSEKLLLDNENKKVDEIMLSNGIFFIPENLHLFDVMKILNDQQMTAIAVVDQNKHFTGIISAAEMMKLIYSKSSLSQPGGIIVLEMSPINYSLAEISRITEVNDIKILNVAIFPVDDGNNSIQVSLKFNKSDLKYVVSTFERFGYSVLYNSSKDEDSSFEDRFNWLIKYINT